MSMESLKQTNRKLYFVTAILLVLCLALVIGLLLHESALDRERTEILEELELNAGQYDETSIVLYGTNHVKASRLAEKFGAKLRITVNGKFATLTLPEGVSVYDIFSDKENREYLKDMSIDYQVRTSEIEEEEESEDGERMASRPNYTVTDSSFTMQTYLDYINMQNVWQYAKGNGITVAVIDSGIDTDHPEFKGRISEYSYNASEDKIVKDYDWSVIEDEQGHGTAVAGVIGASMNSYEIVGIAPQVTILVIKAECDSYGNFKRTSDLVFGLYYAIERDVDVVNMSFGVTGNNPFADATQLAVDSDIICIAAAGNDSTADLTYPAADKNVIGVGALASDSWELASYSNYGENTDMVAPGMVYTTTLNGGYKVMNGTSFASPIVAATVALYKSYLRFHGNPYIEFCQVQELLYASSYDLGDLGEDFYYGYGALDVGALILEEKGTITFNYLTDEIEETTQIFVRNHTLQNMPEPESLYAVFDGWYYDIECTDEYNWYTDRFVTDITLYAKWANEDDSVPYTYVELDDGTIEIRSYTGRRKYITIPTYIDGKVVSSIGEEAFKNQSRLVSVKLPEKLVKIRRSAFEGCTNLGGITIPDTVMQIDTSAFKNDIRLSYVELGGNSSLEAIGQFSFGNCAKLRTFVVPMNVRMLDGSAFFGTTNMTGYTVMKGNAYFASSNGVLFNKTGSTLVAYPAAKSGEYTIPGIVRTIGTCAFGFAKISTIELSNIEIVGDSAFYGSRLETLTIPDNVLNVGASAFASNVHLKNVSLGRGLQVISEKMFAECSDLSFVEIPNTILQIGNSAFNNSGLTTIYFEEDSNLINIGDSAFCATSLLKIEIPSNVISIGRSAFYENIYLSSVTFGEGSLLRIIDVSAFSMTDSLKNITFPSNIEIIGGYAFYESGLIGSVIIPEKVSYYGAGAFASCHQLTSIIVDEDNKAFKDIDGVVYTKNEKTIVEYPAGNPNTSYTINGNADTVYDLAFYGSLYLQSIDASNVKKVLYGAFGNCKNIANYSFELLETIGQYAFFENHSLCSISLPNSVYQISNLAFAQDWNLSEVFFTENATLPRISYQAFAYCGIKTFTVPASVSTMAQGAFEGCKYLTSFTFASGSKLESISAYAFNGCENLQSITFEPGSKLTSIQAHGLEGMRKLTSIDWGDAKITNIDNFAFRFCSSLTTLTMPSTVTNIGRYSFYACTNLERINIPSNVEHIGRYAFLGDEKLNIYFQSDTLPMYLDENWDRGIKGYYTNVANVVDDGDWTYAELASGNIAIVKYRGTTTSVDLTTLPYGNIVTIGGQAFMDSKVESVILPETLITIQNEAFAYSKLKSITIPKNVSFIGREAFTYTPIETVTFVSGSKVRVIEEHAFEGAKQLTSITLPSSLETIGSGAFKSSGLTSVTFEDGIKITEISKECFAYTKLTSVTIPDTVTLINHHAFRETTDMTSVAFGDAETIDIYSNAFYHSGLTSLTIPANVRYIGEYAFVGLNNLDNYEVSAENEYYKSVDGMLLSKDGRKLIAVGAHRTGTITVPETVETIGFGAFEDSDISEVVFNANTNLLTLGYRAFFNSDDIITIAIPKSVVSIDYYAFANCDTLTTITFAEDCGLTGIYEGAFLGCNSLNNITLPDSIIEISEFAFYGCNKLDRIPVSKNSEVKGIYDYAMAYTGLTGDLVLPETLIDIGEYSFRGNKVTSITVPDTNQYDLVIGIGAFQDCYMVEEITLPFIGAMFEDEEISWFGYIFGAGAAKANGTYVPDSLKRIIIQEGIERLFSYTLAYMPNVEIIDLPHSVSIVMNNWIFETTAEYELTNSISVTYANGELQNVFGRDCVGIGIKSIHLSNTITRIGAYTFSGCGSLTNVVIPEGVNSLGDEAFRDCGNLTSITIPQSVTTIGKKAFKDCKSLSSITIPIGIMAIGDGAFENCAALHIVTNNSDLQFTIGSNDYGCITRYAKVLIDKNGNKTYIKDGYEYIETPDGFLFDQKNGYYRLIAYFGGSDTITLPLDINNNVYEIYKLDNVENVIVPKGITTIGNSAFFGCVSLKSISLPEGIESIGISAFNGCSGLTNITIPDGVTTISNGAFSDCYNLKSVILPESLTKIDSFAFSGCYSLTSVILPENVVEIGNEAFHYCKNLTDMTLPNGMQTISNNVFYHCEKLKNITLPKGLLSIGTASFSCCYSLTSIIIPEGVTSIGSSAFSNCSGLTNITIPESVTTISSGAFSGCKSLEVNITGDNFVCLDGVIYNHDLSRIICVLESAKDVIVPDTVSDISKAFWGCDWIKTVTFGNNSALTSIGSHAFYDCSSLTNINIPESVITIDESAFGGCESITDLVIPKGVTKICNGAFHNCSSLTNLEIPEGVISIGLQSFSGCESLVNITIPVGVKEIRFETFSYCSNLVSITIPNTVSLIDTNAFNYCSNLYEITIPSSVETIGLDAFYGCDSLAVVINNSKLPLEPKSKEYGYVAYNAIVIIDGEGNRFFSNDDSEYVETLDGFLFKKDENNYYLIAYLGEKEEIVLPLDINGYSYDICGIKGVKKVEIPDGFTTIGDYAFWDCTSMTSISIPNSVTTIGNCAFRGCKNLKSIVLPNEIKTISDGLFSLCVSLESVILPEGIESICDNAFSSCYNLASIDIPQGVKTIGNSAFAGCRSLSIIELPDCVTTIGSRAFYNCYSLTSIVIPENVTSIGYNCFDNTGYYNDLSNWRNGALFLDNYLLGVSNDCEYVSKSYKMVVQDALSDALSLKEISINGNSDKLLQSAKNLETLVIYEMPSHDITKCFGASIPITLKNVVIKSSVGLYWTINNPFKDITGINIYVESNEQDVRYDEIYPGWNNGNKVYYGNQWINVTTYDENDNVLSHDIFLTSQVIRMPCILPTITDSTTYMLEGWDIDGDGEVDSIPATSTVDITAKAVMKLVDNEYEIKFVDKNGDIISTNTLHYGDKITAPEVPVVNGYTFIKWDNYVVGDTVTGSKVITSTWKHDGEGHDYEKHVVNPTCTEEGYDEYVCGICGESYRDNYTEPTGHTYGDWVIDDEPTCTETGLKHRTCTCSYVDEEVIPATGHEYVGKVIKAATCEEEGEMEYECIHCHDKVTEPIEKTGHHYIKKVVPKWWLQVLIEKVLNFFFGYEGNDGYYYLCTECGHLMLEEEYKASAASVESAEECTHTSGTWKHLQDATTDEYGVDVLVCDICGEVLDVKIHGDIPDITYGDVNGDGKVNGKDATRLLQYLAHWEDIEIDERASDVNGDGKINGKDATRLLQYLAHWDVELGH